MLQGYSHMAVAGIIAATLTAFLHLRSSSSPSIADETQEAFEALGTSLRAVFAQWEKDVLPKTKPSYQLEFRLWSPLFWSWFGTKSSLARLRPFELSPCRTSARTSSSGVASVAGGHLLITPPSAPSAAQSR